MTLSKLRPKVVLWWGIGLTLGGIVLALLLPSIGYALSFQRESSTGVDQALLVLLNLIAQLITQVLPPLGAALIGASVVMAYLRALVTPRPSALPPEPADESR